METLVLVIHVTVSILMILVILLQEGKGGGFGDALGVAGQQTFGVKASGIHRFTAVVALVFLSSALTIHVLNRKTSGAASIGDESSLPADGSGAGIPLPGGIPLGAK